MTATDTISFITHSAKETTDFGHFLATSLRGGHVIGLIGGLGSGKTVLVKAIAQALGVRYPVKSPTFVLMTSHYVHGRGILLLNHVDCYRVGRLTLTDCAALREAMEMPHAVTLIEWADRIPSLLTHIPKTRRTLLTFDVIDTRTRRIAASGALTGSMRKWAKARPS